MVKKQLTRLGAICSIESPGVLGLKYVCSSINKQFIIFCKEIHLFGK